MKEDEENKEIGENKEEGGGNGDSWSSARWILLVIILLILTALQIYLFVRYSLFFERMPETQALLPINDAFSCILRTAKAFVFG